MALVIGFLCPFSKVISIIDVINRNWRCWLMQVDLYDGHKTTVVVVIRETNKYRTDAPG